MVSGTILSFIRLPPVKNVAAELVATKRVALKCSEAFLPQDRPAVDHDHLPGDVVGPVARQKKRRADEVLGLPDPAQGYLLRLGVKLLFPFHLRLGLRRIDRAGTDAVDRVAGGRG